MKILTTWTLPLISLLAACCLLGNSALLAKEVDGLFEISVPVENKSNSNRRDAIREALTEIMIRISGQSTAASNSVIESSLRKSSAYIQRYLYRESDIDKKLMLDLFFDQLSLRNLLRDADLPLWGSNRPQVLIWIAIGDQQQRFLLGLDDQAMMKWIGMPEITNGQSADLISRQPAELTNGQSADLTSRQSTVREILNLQADKRGLPILLPLMDLEDSMSIGVADVWGRFVAPIRQASIRYNSDAILAAQVLKAGDVWTTRWLLLHKGRTISWEQQSSSIESALIAGINATTDQLAEQYAVFEDSLQRNEILISVSNIEHIEDYAQLMDYLQQLTSVQNVTVAKVSNSAIQLRVNLIGDQQAMLQAISLNNRLVKESMPTINLGGVATKLPSLFFHWNSGLQLP